MRRLSCGTCFSLAKWKSTVAKKKNCFMGCYAWTEGSLTAEVVKTWLSFTGNKHRFTDSIWEPGITCSVFLYEDWLQPKMPLWCSFVCTLSCWWNNPCFSSLVAIIAYSKTCAWLRCGHRKKCELSNRNCKLQ